ncbi:MAG TPA: hypothetical protein VK780_01935 [Thermoanaerobaculia bacterium]|nr:hypothetical protein [Thermoanaerobaculia bacterium]
MNEWRREDLAISTDPSRLDRSLIARFLTGSYWAKGIPQEVVDRSRVLFVSASTAVRSSWALRE